LFLNPFLNKKNKIKIYNKKREPIFKNRLPIWAYC